MTSKILALQGCTYFKRSTYICGGDPWAFERIDRKNCWSQGVLPVKLKQYLCSVFWHRCYPKIPDWTPDFGSHSVSLLQRSLAPVTSLNVSSTQTVLWNAVVFSQHFHPCFVPGLTLYLSLCASVLHKFHFAVLLTREPNRLDFTN